MLKQLFALVRGRSHEAAQDFVDGNALVILRQQIRDSAEAVTTARKAVAIAIAQNQQEAAQYRKLVARIEDLEARTVAAIEKGEDDLAREAAGTIAFLETERAASEEAGKNFTTEIERLKGIVRGSELRLRELQRGERIAAATDRTQRLRESSPGAGVSALRDAEETLARLRARQKLIDATASAITEMEHSDDPAAISRKLAEAGCGAPVAPSADDVLARLRKRAGSNA